MAVHPISVDVRYCPECSRPLSFVDNRPFCRSCHSALRRAPLKPARRHHELKSVFDLPSSKTPDIPHPVGECAHCGAQALWCEQWFKVRWVDAGFECCHSLEPDGLVRANPRDEEFWGV